MRSEEATSNRAVALAAASFLSAVTLLSSAPAQAEFRLPPIDSDPNRCERGFVGNTIGQAGGMPWQQLTNADPCRDGQQQKCILSTAE